MTAPSPAPEQPIEARLAEHARNHGEECRCVWWQHAAPTPAPAESMCAVCEHDEHSRECEHCSCDYWLERAGVIDPPSPAPAEDEAEVTIALTNLLARIYGDHPASALIYTLHLPAAHEFLASDWLRERVEQARREGLAEGLAEARSTMTPAQVASTWTDEEMAIWSEQVRTGTDEGHQCCPTCGDDPEDHTLHADGCARVATNDLLISCTNPDGSWNPWPADDAAAREPTP